MRICVLLAYLMVLAISVIFCVMYWQLWSDAIDYNDKAEKLGYTSSVSAYNRCGYPEERAVNTKWSAIYIFNSILYLCLSTFTILLLVGAIKWQLLCSGCLGHCLGILIQLVCICMTGAWRYSMDGSKCADNPDFKDHADKLQALFIS